MSHSPIRQRLSTAALVISVLWLLLAAGCAPSAPARAPTGTPGPASTPVPTEAPTMTPTLVSTLAPLPTDVPTVNPEVRLEVLSYTVIREGPRLVYVAGAAINRGTAPSGAVRTAVSILDAQGKVAAAGSLNEVNIAHVAPGAKFPFLIVVATAPAQFKDVKIQFETKVYTPDQLHKPYWSLNVDKVAGQAPQGAYPTFGYSGQVTNTGPTRARMVQVSAIAFDAGGKVLDVGVGYVAFEYLNPGQDAPFQLFFKSLKAAPARYEMLAEGYLTE